MNNYILSIIQAQTDNYSDIIISIIDNKNNIILLSKTITIFIDDYYPSNDDINEFINNNKSLYLTDNPHQVDKIQLINNKITFKLLYNTDNIITYILSNNEILQFKSEFEKLKLINDNYIDTKISDYIDTKISAPNTIINAGQVPIITSNTTNNKLNDEKYETKIETSNTVIDAVPFATPISAPILTPISAPNCEIKCQDQIFIL
jgi:hypothetical protein